MDVRRGLSAKEMGNWCGVGRNLRGKNNQNVLDKWNSQTWQVTNDKNEYTCTKQILLDSKASYTERKSAKKPGTTL